MELRVGLFLLVSVVAAESYAPTLPAHKLRADSHAKPVPAPRPMVSTRAQRAAVLQASAAVAGGGGSSPQGPTLKDRLVQYRPLLLVVALIVHKCTTDGLTRWTRLQTAYSGATVAMVSEVIKFPLIAMAIASFGGGPSQIVPAFRGAVTQNPFSNAWIALCYTFNNLLYFDALSSISAVAYQVLSQSKTVFTAGLMYVMVGKRLTLQQLAAIVMLIAGALLVQLQELSRATAASAAMGAAASAATSAVLWGGALTLFSSFISALPNVAYEKVLKTEGANQWTNNVQVTGWIMVYIFLSSAFPALLALGRGTAALPSLGSVVPATRAAFDGFTLPVWGVVLLKALNGLLVPATLKYADNILYSYAKPLSIVLMTVCSSLLLGVLPPAKIMGGVALVVASIILYSSKPKAKTA